MAALGDLDPDIKQFAQEMHVLVLIENEREAEKRLAVQRTIDNLVEVINLRQRLDYRLTVISFEIETVLSEIDKEDTRADELKYLLENRRDRAMKLNALANLVGGGGLGVIGSSLGIGNNTIGNIVQTTGSSVEAGLAGASIRAQRDTGTTLHHHSAHQNMLAMIFGFTPNEENTFPESVWNYLNESESPGSNRTRKEALIRTWVELGRIPPLSQPAGKREVALIAGNVKETHDLTISILADRSAMLSDLRAEVAKMNKSLLRLMLALSPE
jgi:hypothetical protein